MNFSTSILAQGFNSDKELNTDSNPRIIDCHLEHLNSEQVTAFIVSIAENDKKAAIVDSGAMASGKTKLAATIAKQLNYESFVAIAHRISLIHGLSKNLNLTNYNDATPHEYLRNLAVCVNSIQKFNVSKRFKNGVVDEFRQTLETILMSNLIENKKEILAEFDALLNNTDFLMCLDADFNEFCLDYLLEHTDKTIYRIHRHIEPHYKQIIERKNHNFIRKECVQNYFNGLNSMVAVSTIAEARKNILYWRECGIKESEILDITGDNRKDDRVKAFYLNPDEEIKQYRFLIYTPSITSGTSIVEPHFDRHYAMFHKVLQSNENLQMIARDRTAQTVYCSFAKDDGKKLPTNLEQLVNGSIKQRQRLKLTKDNILQTSDVKLEPIEVLQLKLQVQFNENLNDYRTNFFNHALNSGYSVKSYDPNRIDEIDDVLQKGLNKRALEHRVNTIFNSPIVDDIQAQIINKAGETTQEETNSLHRYKSTKMAGTSNISEDDVKNYLKGCFKVVLRHESLTANQFNLIQKDLINWQENGKFVSNAGLAHIANEMIALLDGKVIDNTLAFEACQILVKHSDELVANGFTNYAGKEITRPLRTIKNFLNKFGYTTQFLQQRGTVKRERVFTLIKMPHIEQYVSQRQIQKNQAVTVAHANENFFSKENDLIRGQSPEKYPPTENWHKTDVKFSQIDNKFELIT